MTASNSSYAEIREIIKQTFDELGGRASKSDMLTHCELILPPHLTGYLVNRGMDRMIGEFFRSTLDNGLPVAPEVDVHGTHVQLELLSVEEFRFAIRRQMANGAAANRRAKALAAACYEQHGVVIDPDEEIGRTA